MSELETQIKQQIQALDSEDPKERQEAAYFLGEAAADSAIQKLVRVYKQDEDDKVRAAAEYALGMFRAVDLGLNQGSEKERAKVIAALERAEEGEFGSRLTVKTSVLIIVEVVLALVFAGLVAANLLLPGMLGGEGFSINLSLPEFGSGDDGAAATADGEVAAASNRDALTLIAGLRENASMIGNDARTLQTELQTLQNGGAMGCNVFLNNPDAYTLSPTEVESNPDIAGIAETVGQAQENLTEVRTQYEGHCFDEVLIPDGEVAAVVARAASITAPLPGVEEALNEAQTRAQATPTPDPASATAEPGADVTPEETVEVIIANPSQHIRPLYALLDNLTTTRGINGLLFTYWTDAQAAGDTDGCRTLPPTVPDDYVLPPEDAEASPELRQAVEQVNIGLGVTRTGWQLFSEACTNQTLAQQATLGLQTAQTARDAYDIAYQILDELSGLRRPE